MDVIVWFIYLNVPISILSDIFFVVIITMITIIIITITITLK